MTQTLQPFNAFKCSPWLIPHKRCVRMLDSNVPVEKLCVVRTLTYTCHSRNQQSNTQTYPLSLCSPGPTVPRRTHLEHARMQPRHMTRTSRVSRVTSTRHPNLSLHGSKPLGQLNASRPLAQLTLSWPIAKRATRWPRCVTECGGEGFRGDNCCKKGLYCTGDNKWYESCVPRTG